LLNAAFAIEIPDLISQVYLSSFVNMLPKYLKDSTFSSCFWSIKSYYITQNVGNKLEETPFNMKQSGNLGIYM
jgi:hypothetical protein